MPQRKIIQIDEEKCDGCGLCVPSCAEGAIAIRRGKAKLIADVYCDGLGACLGHCPQGAITVIEREAAAFDIAKRPVMPPLVRQKATVPFLSNNNRASPRSRSQATPRNKNSCPFAFPVAGRPARGRRWPTGRSSCGWFSAAPYLDGADLLLVADCVAFALADFHRQLVQRRPVLIGCPKLDDAQGYVEKLAQILARGGGPFADRGTHERPLLHGLAANRPVGQETRRIERAVGDDCGLDARGNRLGGKTGHALGQVSLLLFALQREDGIVGFVERLVRPGIDENAASLFGRHFRRHIGFAFGHGEATVRFDDLVKGHGTPPRCVRNVVVPRVSSAAPTTPLYAGGNHRLSFQRVAATRRAGDVSLRGPHAPFLSPCRGAGRPIA